MFVAIEFSRGSKVSRATTKAFQEFGRGTPFSREVREFSWPLRT